MKTAITIIMGIFLLASVSAIYAGETETITFTFEPVACAVDEGIDFTIDSYNVDITPQTNFLGNFTLTCFSGDEASPVIEYRGGGGGGSSRTIYKNVTEYKDVIKFKEVPGEEKIVEIKGDEIIKEKTVYAKNAKILLFFFVLIIFGLLGYIISKSNHRTEKEVEEYE